MESASYLLKISEKKQKGFRGSTPLSRVVLNNAFKNAIYEFLKKDAGDRPSRPVIRQMEFMPIINE